MKSSHLLLGLLAAAALIGCNPTSDSTSTVDDADADVAVSEAEQAALTRKGAYFIVTHPDFRKCAYPMCGGWFVKQVNRRSTECVDGTLQAECHAADLNLDITGLGPDAAAKFESAFGASQALVRGWLKAVPDGYGNQVDTLVVTEAWLGASGSTPTGRFFGVTDSGILCVTYPCPSYHEARLNSPLERNIHGVDLAASGAAPKAVEKGYEELAATGVLVAGVHDTITGPAGTGIELVASEFYTRLLPLKEEGEQCGNTVCTGGTYCCNASCGWCAPEGWACIQIACSSEE